MKRRNLLPMLVITLACFGCASKSERVTQQMTALSYDGPGWDFGPWGPGWWR
jgi:hypothetical protein